MNMQTYRLVAGLIACTAPAWAAATELPSYGTYSGVADFAGSVNSPYWPHSDITTLAGETASISVSSSYSASASTAVGSNHASTSADTFPRGTLEIQSFSGWYDQVTISGGSGIGTVHFSVQLNGVVDAGAFAGMASYGLYASSVHPSLVGKDPLINYSLVPTYPWFLFANEVTSIAGGSIGVSPYNDTSALFTTEAPPDGVQGIPPQVLVDQILSPGTGQNVNITVSGTLSFTYGEAFYLLGALDTDIASPGYLCLLGAGDTCGRPIDGTGATTLDFSNRANFVNIALPTGATASFASGTAYNVTAVPEPAEWAMLLVGLGLVGWRARRKAA